MHQSVGTLLNLYIVNYTSVFLEAHTTIDDMAAPTITFDAWIAIRLGPLMSGFHFADKATPLMSKGGC